MGEEPSNQVIFDSLVQLYRNMPMRTQEAAERFGEPVVHYLVEHEMAEEYKERTWKTKKPEDEGSLLKLADKGMQIVNDMADL